MHKSRTTKKNAAWWQFGVQLIGRLRNDPGTENLNRFGKTANACSDIRQLLYSVDSSTLGIGLHDLRERTPEVPGRDEAAVLAYVAELAHRTIGLDPVESQILAAISMMQGCAVDMETGEGKTLVGFLVAGSLAVSGRRVHVLSANDYLAQRDAEASGPFFDHLGVSVSFITDPMDVDEKRNRYRADVIYTTVHQVGFDTLRDRQRVDASAFMVPELDVAIIDEIDAVLLDDATVPLVIADESPVNDMVQSLANVIAEMTRGRHYEVDSPRTTATFTEAGITHLERRLGVVNLYSGTSIDLLTAAHLAPYAEVLLIRDVDYLVSDGRVQIINKVRGRVSPLQRWPDGLQTAIEQKEGLSATSHAKILDQMLVESVVRRYRFCMGMSGSAVEAAQQLAEDLQLRIGAIPSHLPRIRVDESDQLFRSVKERNKAAALRVLAAHTGGQPVLVATQNVVESERFSQLLIGLGMDPVVLNAKNHADEASILASAGRPAVITVSTRMAGRGIDIRLDRRSKRLGGLLVLGLERCGSARDDRQLRGRAGRHGSPGRSVFYTSLEDSVVTQHLVLNLVPQDVGPDGVILDRRFHRIYDHAQRVAEGKTMQRHRTTRDYQRIIDAQRDDVLAMRAKVMAGDGLACLEGWPFGKGCCTLSENVRGLGESHLVRDALLMQLDDGWTQHLSYLMELRDGIHLRSLAKQNPLQEFTRLANQAFTVLLEAWSVGFAGFLKCLEDGTLTVDDPVLARPSATWTYLVADSPFGSEIDRVVESLAKFIHRGAPPSIRYV
ncbi:preprotein translocase subunit SecA [Mycetocola sp. BIGb0189]|uniref:preprotein translocase subunit SecA n=1 Tax=Mycetocola sp. BIGb0189 TaxID=2940604 RepID=UPI0021695D01|nr:DEAD/DEAH box helicase [Mycetocola sp. BIGb0189]MCS4274926.1 preprotein translocase subunit SecA [Mycetocola sp. BIGb0189]